MSNSKSNSSDSDSDAGVQVRIALQLAPDCWDRSLALDKSFGAIAVPADVGRKGLSAVVNHLLDRRLPKGEQHEEDEEPEDADRLPAIPFDFIVGKASTTTRRLLRTGIEREARRSGLTLEEAIPVTYFPAQTAPTLDGESEELPDWIAALQYVVDAGTKKHYLCSGCYDGSIHIFQARSNNQDEDSSSSKSTSLLLEKVATQLPERSGAGAIKSLAMGINDSSQDLWLAAGSMDHSLRLYRMDTETHKLRRHADCIGAEGGHAAAVSSVDFWLSSNQMYLASADWDGAIKVWDLKQDPSIVASTEVVAPVVKKTKTSGGLKSSSAAEEKSSNPTLSSKLSWQAHSSKISGISWGNYEKINHDQHQLPEQLVTGSWDHTIKVWDVERQDCLLTLNGSRVVSCLDTSYHSRGIVATGHPDCTVRLWDTRIDSNDPQTDSSLIRLVSDRTFQPSHKEWVTVVQWSRHNAYHLASTSHDGTVKLWDIRSPLPLHTVRQAFVANHESTMTATAKTVSMAEKGLALVYGDGGYLFAGGTNRVVKQFHCASASGATLKAALTGKEHAQ